MILQQKWIYAVVLGGIVCASLAEANPGAGKAAQAGAEVVNGARGALRLGSGAGKAPVGNVKAPISATPLVTLPPPAAAEGSVGAAPANSGMATSKITQDSPTAITVDAMATASGEAKLQDLKVAFNNTLERRRSAGDISSSQAETLRRAFELGILKNQTCVELSQDAVHNLSQVAAYAVKKLEELGTNLFVVNESGLNAVAEEWVTGMMQVIGQSREEAIEKTIGLAQSCGLSDRIGGMAASLN